MTNCNYCIHNRTSTVLFSDWSNTEKMFTVFVFEHIILIIMFLYTFLFQKCHAELIAVLKDQFKATGGVVNSVHLAISIG